MGKKTVRRSGRALLSWIGLMAVVCVPSFIAGAAYTKAGKSIMPLNAVVPESEAGTQPLPNEARTEFEPSTEWQTVRMRVTAYCPCSKCCGQYADGMTACGYKIQPTDTFVAADKRYSFGTEMIVPGYSSSRAVKVLDRGGVIKGNRLDVFFHSHQQALEWGVKYLDVQVPGK